MKKADIVAGLCLRRPNCQKCFKSCPKRAIFKLDIDDNAMINRSICNGCGDRVVICPKRAIKIIEI